MEYRCGDVEELMSSLLEEKPDLLLLDPPRAGLSKETTGQITWALPKAVFYVSCNPATFARDARRLVDGGFSLAKVVPFDMFPQTSEIEVLGVFRAPAPAQR